MSAKFKQRITDGRGIEFVRLSGVLDEDNELDDLTLKLAEASQPTVLLLSRVERINDAGARAFSTFLEALSERGDKVVLVDCSPAVVTQLNQLGDLAAPLLIKSFSAPYFCPECDEPRVLVCEVADFDGPPTTPPVKRCDHCDFVMQFDDEPGPYFAFLGTKLEPVDPELDRRIIEHRISELDESTAPGLSAEMDSIPHAPRRAPTATGPVDRVGLSPWLVVALFAAVAIAIALWWAAQSL